MLGKLGLATACAWLALTASALATPTWLAPTDIAGPTTSITFPEIAVNAGGDAVAIWPRNTGSETVVEVIERSAGVELSGPEVISDPGEEELSSVHIGLDDAGNAVAVWRAYDFAYVIRTAARPAGGEWSAPEDLFAGGGQSPQLAMNGAGDAVVVWILSVAGGDVVAQAAERPAGGDWLAPDDLSVTGEDAGSPSIAIDAAGTATAVWQLSDPGENEIRAAVRTASDNWSAPQPLSNPGENAQPPRLAINEAGDAVAAWTVGSNALQAVTRPAGGGWSEPKEISATGGEPALAVDSSGNSFALWPTGPPNERVLQVAMRPPGGDWSAPDDLSDEATTFQSYDLDANAAAGVVATWTRSPNAMSHEVQAAVRPPDGASWSAPEEISTPGENSGLPQLGFDAEGNAIAIWGREAASDEYFLRGSGYDFSGPRLDDLRIPATGIAGQPVSFSVSPFDVFPLGITSWSFGDGGQASGDAVSHTYAAPGKYPVTVSAVDGSGNASTRAATISIADLTAPAAPRLLGTSPASPNASDSPRIRGEAEADSTVRLYSGPGCSGTPLATSGATELASPGIRVGVAEGVTASFSATATDVSGNTSACSAPISYTRVKPAGPEPVCIVPKLVGKKLKVARKKIRATGCTVGKVRRPKARKARRRPLVVKSSNPPARKSLPAGSKVDLRLGPKPRKAHRMAHAHRVA